MTNAADDRAAGGPIVVVDDDPLFLKTLCLNLEDAGFRAVPFESGQAAIDYFAGGHPAAAMLLDWHMPGVDGPQVLKHLRDSGSRVPVLFLTALHQPIYEEAALARGAVDFVEKSRSFALILSRLKIVLAGAKTPIDAAASSVAPPTGLEFDDASARVLWQGQRVDLTLTEFKVARLLAARPGRDVSYREIYDVMRGEGFRAGVGDEGYRANVRALIKRVRQKFKAIDPGFVSLENYPGFGYRWVDDGRP
ncbi:MAG: response regulator transcription factor [Proteobacteria bacterium]|nr:response regulator transcription factor [Pseudomonadota bacterium]